MKKILEDNGIENIEQFAQFFEDVHEPDQNQEYQPANVEEVLKRVRSDFQSSITVLESAMKSAEQHAKFRFPYRVWEVFNTLNELHERAVQMNRQRNQRVNLGGIVPRREWLVLCHKGIRLYSWNDTGIHGNSYTKAD